MTECNQEVFLVCISFFAPRGGQFHSGPGIDRWRGAVVASGRSKIDLLKRWRPVSRPRSPLLVQPPAWARCSRSASTALARGLRGSERSEQLRHDRDAVLAGQRKLEDPLAARVP